MDFKIVSDSSSDIITLGDISYSSVPLKIITDTKEYVDDSRLDVGSMITDLQSYKGTSRSSCPNIDEWKSAFGEHDGIICVTMTSALSGSNNAANLALNDHLSSNPQKRGFVLDTLSTGPENALIIEKLKELVSSNIDIDKIKERIMEYKSKTHLIFSLDSLTNLANNGRVSHAVAKLSGILGIRIVGKASSEGTLEITNKSRGAKKALSDIFENMIKSGYNGGNVRIHHCRNLKAADELAQRIKAQFMEAAIKIQETRGLCSFYAESGGLLIGFEG